ncbi:uncharacterized protein PFL1_02835 [Pseudozyma flocculosa PF-1]|uniref:Sld7 C-terminal domain-containing protein n=2 Tax=Pseudozyma flocculosa TaxID=84751 RepID=A0A5C3F3C6_9BASI|nr:uncharacterized protein PFL1_02835 [Pseudozyma flocculosa PF-1]EPQ29616.1 hypothetical protein PFL1_02835 [Pseudozyma flocculosa PF-1]SPO38177.1 uncharacterized protein PSFLO_03654 [Pseudozyma flocculosa]
MLSASPPSLITSSSPQAADATAPSLERSSKRAQALAPTRSYGESQGGGGGNEGPCTPASVASPRTTLAKPRLLWKSSLTLPDGTLLPGIAFASHIDPFQHRPDAAFGIAGDSAFGDQGALRGQLEAEESLCLALEMVRHRSLRITSILEDRGARPASPDSFPTAGASRGFSRSSSMPQPSLGGHSQPVQRPSAQLGGTKETHWLASGEIRVYINPSELSTVTFFERHFCSDAELVPGSAGTPPRSKKIFTISLDSSIDGDAASGSGLGPNRRQSGGSSAASEFAIFGQLLEAPPTTPDVSRRLDYFGSAPTTAAKEAPPQAAKVLSLVIGRRVVVARKPPSDTAVLGSGRGRGSNASATLDSVFSQAGLSLPQFGLGPPSLGQRPDDPLPRGSIASLLQARALKRTRSVAGAATTEIDDRRGTSPLGSDQAGSMAPPSRRGSQGQVASAVRGTSSNSGGDGRDEGRSLPSARSGLPRGAIKAVASNNTPGRRGEKRPRRLLAIDEVIEEQDVDRQPAGRATTSPSKRRGPKADRVQLDGSGSSFHARLLAASRGSISSSARPSPAPSDVKSEAMTPELPSLPLFDTQEDASFLSQLGTQQRQQPNSASLTAAPLSPVERSNRTMIKKLVYSILVTERGLRKGDDDFAACYTQAYSGTWCAFRRQGPSQRLDRAAVERVVRIHLDMYVDGPPP